MSLAPPLKPQSLVRDLTAGLVVFLVALPLCLGIALASGAPLVSGLVSGIIGGIVVGFLSGSHTSVSGPAAGLTTIVAGQIAVLGSFEQFLLAVAIAGAMQIGLGLLQAGQLSTFAPSSVIKGLLAAIGVILILKQIPHILGHDTDPEGEMAFVQPDKENTFSEIVGLFAGDVHRGAAVVGLLSIGLLILWDKWPILKKTRIPAPLAAVIAGLGLSYWFGTLGGPWAIGATHRVQVPVTNDIAGLATFFTLPKFDGLWMLSTYRAAAIIALVASLETLLNLEAVDRLDPFKRKSPPNRELIAQGIGNMIAGSVGGIPVTSVIVRSSVNINAGSSSKVSAIFHGVLLVICVVFLPRLLNLIPIACLAAILLVTGFKLASPHVFRQMYRDGRYQFIPFLVTVVAIVFTDLIVGVLIGLAVSLSFILNSNFRRPLRTVNEKHLGGDVLRIELANQVSFLNIAAIDRVFNRTKPGSHLLIDAGNTDYIDPDVLAYIRDFTTHTAPARDIHVSLSGFRQKYALIDEIQYIDYSSRELQSELTPNQVLQILIEGNERFRNGKPLHRDVNRQLQLASVGQHPLAVVLSCIDSRTPAEVVFDLGIGDIFSARIAGNIICDQIIGSIEYSCAVAGAKLVLVMGHSQCGAVAATVDIARQRSQTPPPNDCDHILPIVTGIMQSITSDMKHRMIADDDGETRTTMIDDTSRRNVVRSVKMLLDESRAIRRLVDQGRVSVVGAFYNVASGKLEILTNEHQTA
jgi:carbonic anhydrase